MIDVHSQPPAAAHPVDTGSIDSREADMEVQRWTSVFHSANGWMHAPPDSHFQRRGEMIELVGAVHRCGRVWYASSITKLGDET